MQPRSDGGMTPWEMAAVLALGAMLVLGGLVVLTAGVAGVISGDGWTGGSLSDAPAVLARLPDHLDDPHRAWPASTASHMPGPVAFYVSAALVVLAVGALGAVALRMRRRFSHEAGARWARRGELKRLEVRHAQPGRITLGRHGGKLVAAERGQSVLAIAPTQSGKTTALAIPNILAWDGPVVALSIKTDLVRDTIDARRRVGTVAVFDPTDATGIERTQGWTPLPNCRTWAAARRIARTITDAANTKESMADGDFWNSAAAKLLAPLLFAAASAGLTMDTLIAWVDTQEESEVLAILEEAGDEEALNALRANWSRDERQRSSIYTTLETILEAYADRGVLEHSRAPEIRAEWFLDGGAHTIYLCASAREQRRLRPVFITLLDELLEAAYAKASAEGKALEPSLLLVLDEVANIAPLPELDVIASTAAGHGIQLLTLLQDLAQAQDRWGRERAETLMNNHRARLLGAGLADERALEWARRMLGDTAIVQRSRTSGDSGRRSITEGEHFRPLAAPNVVRERSAGSALLVYGSLRPAWIRLQPWYLRARHGPTRPTIKS